MDSELLTEVRRSMPQSADLSERYYSKQDGSLEMQLWYLSPLVDQTLIHRYVLLPFHSGPTARDVAETLKINGAEALPNPQDAGNLVMNGSAVLALNGCLYAIGLQRSQGSQPGEPVTENTVIGPQKSLSEDMTANLQLIRSRYPKKQLQAEYYEVGTDTRTKIVLLADTAKSDPAIVNEVRLKLAAIQVDVLQASGQLERLLHKSKYSLFPVIMITERPDRIVLNLAKGKIALLVEGTSFALVLPAVFYDVRHGRFVPIVLDLAVFDYTALRGADCRGDLTRGLYFRCLLQSGNCQGSACPVHCRQPCGGSLPVVYGGTDHAVHD